MNRRAWLKTIAAGGASAALMGSWRSPTEAAPAAWFIVTDRPGEAIRSVLKAARLRAYEVDVDVQPIEPAPSDLTLLRGGKLIDPHADARLPHELVALASELRRTASTGRFLATIEVACRSDSELVVFECDGQVVERLNLQSSFKRIVIPGSQGDTVFALEDGMLSVVSSSCRHEVCKKLGPVRTGRIICAPNRLVATVSGRRMSVDAVTG